MSSFLLAPLARAQMELAQGRSSHLHNQRLGCGAARTNRRATMKTHSFPPVFSLVRVSAVWVFSAWGDRGLCQGTDGGDWAGGQSGQRGRGPRGEQQPNLWPWLGGNEQNPDAGFFFFSNNLLLLPFLHWNKQCCP